RTFNQCHRQVDAAGKDIAMLTRRTTLFASAAAGAWLAQRSADAHAATASTVKTPVNFDVPRGACDCHVHVFDPARFPYFTGRIYTPPEATAEDLLALQKQLHFDRVVIVQPSVYGIDNACALDAMKKLGPVRARGLAPIDATVGQGHIDDVVAAGRRRAPHNFETFAQCNPHTAKRRGA